MVLKIVERMKENYTFKLGSSEGKEIDISGIISILVKMVDMVN